MPIFVTSNAYIASSYARLILAYLHDWFSSSSSNTSSSSSSRSSPVTVLELGAGHGRLSFLVLRELWAMEEQWPEVPATPQFTCALGRGGRRVPFRFVMTDIMPSCLDFWGGHESLVPFVAAGVLEFGVVDAECAGGWGATTLRPSGRVLSPGSLSSPVVILANYLFDTLRQDLFRVVEGGTLQQALVTLLSPNAEDAQGGEDVKSAGDGSGGGSSSSSSSSSSNSSSSSSSNSKPLDPTLLSRMRLEWTYEPLS